MGFAKVWKLGLGVGMSVAIVAAYWVPMPEFPFADAEGYRAVFFHVPTAWVATLAFIVAMVYAVKYLRGRDLRDDEHSATAAQLGLVFAFLATVTGAILSRNQWGMYWNWDPRQTAIVVLLLLYGAYWALRGAIDEEEQRARLAAVYAIVSVVPMLFLIWIVPRVMPSLHPQRAPFHAAQGGVLLATMLNFTGLYFWLHRLHVALLRAIRAEGREKANDC
ncbi:MAG TPA: cytochrome C biogenesis protein [Armatimonadetes bacterium]|nr:cytochrome C biogenesis protein [Armatimonadota bacterium]